MNLTLLLLCHELHVYLGLEQHECVMLLTCRSDKVPAQRFIHEELSHRFHIAQS